MEVILPVLRVQAEVEEELMEVQEVQELRWAQLVLMVLTTPVLSEVEREARPIPLLVEVVVEEVMQLLGVMVV